MANKKSQMSLVNVVLIILLMLAAIVIVWQIVRSELEPQLTISKDECVSETGYYYVCSDRTIIISIDETLDGVIYKNMSCYRKEWKIKEICSQVEVDEDFCWTLDEEHKLIFLDGNEICKDKEKLKLSLILLSKNCEKLEFCNKKDIGECYDIINNSYYECVQSDKICVIPAIGKSGEGNYWRISKYKCSKYTIDVSK